MCTLCLRLHGHLCARLRVCMHMHMHEDMHKVVYVCTLCIRMHGHLWARLRVCMHTRGHTHVRTRSTCGRLRHKQSVVCDVCGATCVHLV